MKGPQPQMPSLSPCLHYFPPTLPAVPTSLRVGLLPQGPQVAKLPFCERRSSSTFLADSPPTTQGEYNPPPGLSVTALPRWIDMLNLTGECIHRQTSQDNGISNTQLRIELAAWLMIDEQEIKIVKPTLVWLPTAPTHIQPYAAAKHSRPSKPYSAAAGSCVWNPTK